MRRLFQYVCVMLLTFAGGAVTANFWLASSRNVQPHNRTTVVKAIERKIQVSDYLVTKAFANQLRDGCIKRGVRVTIDKTKFTN
jgi:hypothetical protein